MKILLKNKYDKRCSTLDKRIVFLDKKRSGFEVEMFYACSIILSLYGALGIFLHFAINDESGLSIGLVALCFNFIFFTPVFKKIKKNQGLKDKAIKEKNYIDSELKNLKIKENYRIFYKEMLELSNSDKLDLIDECLVQSIIEEYRKKEFFKKDRISNSKRLNYFTEYELNNIDNTLEIENN